MLLEILLILAAILLGVAAGIITGLTPGVHINLVSAILLALAPALATHIPLLLVCILIMAMAVAHTFLDSIPSIFLGAPDDEKALGVLPGHRYLLRGNGLMAIKLCIIGGLLGAIIAAALFVPSIWAISALADLGKQYLFWVILAIVIFMVFKDNSPLLAAIIFVWCGLLGIVTLRLPLDEPLLPLLSGMFGVATLLYSINESQNIPPQRDECYTEIDKAKAASGGMRGFAAGFITALLPGVSAASASALASRGGKLGDHGFLILLGSLGTASFILSLASFIAIEKARNGAMAVMVQLSAINAGSALLLISVALAAAGIASLITLALARKAAHWLPRMPYRETCIGVIVFVAAIVFVRTGWLGMLVLVASTAAGLLPAALRTARSQAMGCLLLPLLVVLW
jgi:putative membrane protein